LIFSSHQTHQQFSPKIEKITPIIKTKYLIQGALEMFDYKLKDICFHEFIKFLLVMLWHIAMALGCESEGLGFEHLTRRIAKK